jgi:hypothetical protein
MNHLVKEFEGRQEAMRPDIPTFLRRIIPIKLYTGMQIRRHKEMVSVKRKGTTLPGASSACFFGGIRDIVLKQSHTTDMLSIFGLWSPPIKDVKKSSSRLFVSILRSIWHA